MEKTQGERIKSLDERLDALEKDAANVVRLTASDVHNLVAFMLKSCGQLPTKH